jgi:DNA-binding response OmpR family regulator
MTSQHPMLMYVGDSERSSALASAAEERGGHIYFVDDTLEALAMVVFYYPDAVIVDAALRPTLALEVAHHLLSMTGVPVPIVVIGAMGDFFTTVPADADPDTILDAVVNALATTPALHA